MATILLVEDNELNSDMLTRRLVRRGFDVLLAEDGEQGVEMAKTRSPDLILMDMSLPVLDGWEATQQIKADPQTAHIPVIALTAHAMPEDRERAKEVGCDDFEPKPVDLTHLVETINTILNVDARSC